MKHAVLSQNGGSKCLALTKLAPSEIRRIKKSAFA